MNSLLLKLFGAHVPQGTELKQLQLGLHSVIHPGWLVLIAALIIAFVVWNYRRPVVEMSDWRRVVLDALRCAFLLLCLLLLLRPSLVLTLEGRVRRAVAILMDASRSMNIPNTPGTNTATRFDSVNAALNNSPLLPELQRRFDVHQNSFGGNVTAIGDAIRDTLAQNRSQPLAGIVLFTDGANNSGTQPQTAAQQARDESVPLYICAVGSRSPPDIILTGLFAPDIAFVNDEISATVRIRAQGITGTTARVELTLDKETVTTETATLSSNAEQTVALKFTPTTAGEYELRASIPPLPDEMIKDNNSASQRLRVLDSKIKVLLVEQTPRWEFRYLQALLLRDRRVELKCVLFEGDPGISTGENSPYLAAFPQQKEDLFRYDLVILGDVDPKLLTGEQLDALGKFVSKFSGAIVLIAGKRFTPQAYRNTVIEKLLPVELDSYAPTGDTDTDQPIQLTLTPAGKTSAMLRLADTPEDSLARWTTLPPVYWIAHTGHAKAAAEILLDAPRSAAERTPVLVLQQYGAGRVLYFGTDNTWRWRKNVGDTFFATLWGQIVQRMALPHLLGGAKRTHLNTDRQQYATGDRVTMFARLYTTTFEPVLEPTVRAFCTPMDGRSTSVVELRLRAASEQPGMYRGEFIAPAPGRYRLDAETDSSTFIEFNVAEPRFELGDTAMNEPLLRELAALSGGAFFNESDWQRIPAAIDHEAMPVRSTMEVDVWATPLYFLLMLVLVTAEWILRKISQLK